MSVKSKVRQGDIVRANREYFIPLGGKIFRRYTKEVKAQKQGHLMIGGAFISRNMIGQRVVI